MNILIVSEGYPDKYHSFYSFVKQLVEEWARQGHNCTVVTPYSITSNKRFHKFSAVESIDENSFVTVLRPNYISTSNLSFAGFCPSSFFFRKAVCRAFRRIGFRPDVVYCHFWNSCIAAYDFASKNSLPLYVACGESDERLSAISIANQDIIKYVKGVICVSTWNRKICIEQHLSTFENTQIFNNAINTSTFRVLDKESCRERLNLPKEAFIIISVGSFDERKGISRVSKAIESLKDNSINAIFIGSGPDKPSCSNILYKGKSRHSLIPEYLNSADVFVLPTLSEGCCNAIIEAMACGLPIISSDKPFNYDILDETNSILVDPTDINQIANAIIELKCNNELRDKLRKGAINKAQYLSIANRASGIIEFIQSRI